MSLTFWKPGTVGPGSNLDRASETEETIVPYAPAESYLSIQSQQERLPIFKHRESSNYGRARRTYLLFLGEKLLYCVERYGVVVVVGQTGCGKTTRESCSAFHAHYSRRWQELPQYLLQAGWAREGHVIACTQPRRIAATSVAARVANEVGTKLGDEVWIGKMQTVVPGSDFTPGRIYHSLRGRQQQRRYANSLYDRWNAVSRDVGGPFTESIQCYYGGLNILVPKFLNWIFIGRWSTWTQCIHRSSPRRAEKVRLWSLYPTLYFDYT